MRMVVEVLRYQLVEGQEAAFEDAYRQTQKCLTDSPHCRGYELTRCLQHRSRYLLLIRWDSVDGHLQGFRGSSAFQRFLALVAPFFQQIEEMEHYEPTGIESINQP
jgi:heme-degrading monooxygenase HmoA